MLSGKSLVIKITPIDVLSVLNEGQLFMMLMLWYNKNWCKSSTNWGLVFSYCNVDPDPVNVLRTTRVLWLFQLWQVWTRMTLNIIIHFHYTLCYLLWGSTLCFDFSAVNFMRTVLLNLINVVWALECNEPKPLWPEKQSYLPLSTSNIVMCVIK